MNHIEGDLIRLTNQNYTPQEIEFNNLKEIIEEAKANLTTALKKALTLLQPYGISPNEISEFVNAKLK